MTTQATTPPGADLIPLSRGFVAVIDAEDAPLLAGYSWYAHTSKGRTGAQANLPTDENGVRRQVKMHRLLTSAPPGSHVDHRNHDTLDNRRANLRVTTASNNGGNMLVPRHNTSGYKGVTWRNGRWEARLVVQRHTYRLGRYDDPWQAALAYNAGALEHFGEFAYLNTRQETHR